MFPNCLSEFDDSRDNWPSEAQEAFNRESEFYKIVAIDYIVDSTQQENIDYISGTDHHANNLALAEQNKRMIPSKNMGVNFNYKSEQEWQELSQRKSLSADNNIDKNLMIVEKVPFNVSAGQVKDNLNILYADYFGVNVPGMNLVESAYLDFEVGSSLPCDYLFNLLASLNMCPLLEAHFRSECSSEHPEIPLSIFS